MRTSVRELEDGVSRPLVSLARDLGQFCTTDPLRDPLQRSSGIDCLELPVITDKHKLCASTVNLSEKPLQMPSPNHSGFVKDDNTRGREIPLTALEFMKKPMHVRAPDS